MMDLLRNIRIERDIRYVEKYRVNFFDFMCANIYKLKRLNFYTPKVVSWIGRKAITFYDLDTSIYA